MLDYRTSFTTKCYNSFVSIVGIALAYLGGLLACNIIGKILTELGPRIKTFITHIVAHRHSGYFNLVRHHAGYTEAAAVCVGLLAMCINSYSLSGETNYSLQSKFAPRHANFAPRHANFAHTPPGSP